MEQNDKKLLSDNRTTHAICPTLRKIRTTGLAGGSDYNDVALLILNCIIRQLLYFLQSHSLS